MPNENLGWLILIGSVSSVGYIGLIVSHFHFKHNLLSIAVKSWLLGLVLVLFYGIYASLITDHTLLDLLTNKVPISEVMGFPGGVRVVFPLHLLGYILIAGGLFLLPFSVFLKDRKP